MLVRPARLYHQLLIGTVCLSRLALYAASWAEFSEKTRANITPHLSSIETLHKGKSV